MEFLHLAISLWAQVQRSNSLIPSKRSSCNSGYQIELDMNKVAWQLFIYTTYNYITSEYQFSYFFFMARFVSYDDRAALVTFYSPYITRIPEHLPPAHAKAWQSEIRSQLDSAALQTNSILNDLVREKLLAFAGPMT